VILEQAPNPASSSTALLLAGLAQPSGIAIDRRGNVYFTQIPTPGVPGGANSVSVVSAFNPTTVTLISQGEPEPSDVAVSDDGVLYWTFKTAGVILTRNRQGTISLLLGGLTQPTGIALDEQRNLLYWTELPTPGIPGSMGGMNKIWVYEFRGNSKSLVDAGDPEPTDIAVAPNGRVYWTCSSAGVIVEAQRR
jgi:DNA-binding beta-propeller fold protein YncE